jgi:hypothetical protein
LTREEIKQRMNVTITHEVPMHEEKLVLNEDTIAENGLWFAPQCTDYFCATNLSLWKRKYMATVGKMCASTT